MSHVLRDYQHRALDELRGELRAGRRRLILQLATGGGKTSIAAEMIRCALDKGKRAMFVADRIKLIDQASDRLDAEGIPHGVIQGDHWRTDFSKPAQVASVQTIARRKIPDFDLVIIDEAHVLYKGHLDLFKRWDNVPMIGLSATPWARGLGKYFHGNVVGATTRELIDLGFLVEPRVFAPSSPDLHGVQIKRGDYDVGQLGTASNKPKLVADIVETWMKHGRGRLTMAFAVNVAHSLAIVESFQRAGVRAEHVDGYMPQEDVKAGFDRLRRGDIEILSSVDLASRGVDIPEVSCGIMARPTKSLMLHVQQVGRLIRAHPGKVDAVVLDHAGNTERLGFVTDDLPTELDDGTKKAKNPEERKEPLPKKCPACHAMKPAKAHKCPECGFAPKTQPRGIEQEAGELVEVGRKKGKIATADKKVLYAELLGYAREKGMKDGWAYYAVRDLCGSAPRDRLKAMPPSPATMNLIRHLHIKRAKGRAAA